MLVLWNLYHAAYVNNHDTLLAWTSYLQCDMDNLILCPTKIMSHHRYTIFTLAIPYLLINNHHLWFYNNKWVNLPFRSSKVSERLCKPTLCLRSYSLDMHVISVCKKSVIDLPVRRAEASWALRTFSGHAHACFKGRTRHLPMWIILIKILLGFIYASVWSTVRCRLPVSVASLDMYRIEIVRPHLTGRRCCHCGVSRAGRFIWTYPLQGARGRACHPPRHLHTFDWINK